MPITVNGVEITDAAIHAEMRHHPAPSREIAEYSARLALVAKELLLQEAARLEIGGIDEDARIAALIEREVGDYPGGNEPHRAISRYLSILMGRATIRGIDLLGAGSPLMR
jgi:hypothetical protein